MITSLRNALSNLRSSKADPASGNDKDLFSQLGGKDRILEAIAAALNEQAPGVPVTVTPSDVTEYATGHIRSIRVGTGGNLTVVNQDGTSVSINNVQDGELLPVRDIKKVMSSGTTATDIIALT